MKKDLFNCASQSLQNNYLVRTKSDDGDHGTIEIWKFHHLVIGPIENNKIGFTLAGGTYWVGLCESKSWDDNRRSIDPNLRFFDPVSRIEADFAELDIFEMSNRNRFLSLKVAKNAGGSTRDTAERYGIPLLCGRNIVLGDNNDLDLFLPDLLLLMGVPSFDVIRIREDIEGKICLGSR